jgi:hypothetical protein
MSKLIALIAPTAAFVIVIFFIWFRQNIINACIGCIKANIEHHEDNEHRYRQPCGNYSGRSTTSVTKDELFDLILNHIGMEVKETTTVNAKLVPKQEEEEEESS